MRPSHRKKSLVGLSEKSWLKNSEKSDPTNDRYFEVIAELARFVLTIPFRSVLIFRS